MENPESRSKFQKWVAHVTLYKSDDRKFYCQRSNWIPTCRQNTGSPPLLSMIMILATSLTFFLSNYFSNTSFMYYRNDYLEDLNGEHKLPEIVNFLQFRSGGSWIGFLTVFTSFFFATELQMYVSNVFAILFISIPIEMVHGTMCLLKLFFLASFSNICAGYFLTPDSKFTIIGASIALQTLVYAHIFNLALQWKRVNKTYAATRVVMIIFWLIQDNTWHLFRYYATMNTTWPLSSYGIFVAPIVGVSYGVILVYTYRAKDDNREGKANDNSIRNRTIKEYVYFGVIIVASAVMLVLGKFFDWK